MRTNSDLIYAFLILLFFFLLFMSSCAKHVPVRARETIAEHQTWVAARVTEGTASCQAPCETILIWARSRPAVQEAIEDLCKSQKSYVCLGPDADGFVFIVERRRR